MKNLYYVMGKSSSGKDTIYKRLLADEELRLVPLVPYTTRPIRVGEVDGREYHFVTKEIFEQMNAEKKVAEFRVYNTIHGEWIYFTAFDDETIGSDKDFIVIGTVESFASTKKAMPQENIYPVYIELDDGERLQRALTRERAQENPKYKEMCRRFLADQEDFSEEKIKAAGILHSFYNETLETCVEEIKEYIRNPK